MEEKKNHRGLAGEIAHLFIDSKLTPLIVITSVLLGLGAIFLLPREEEPQIKVPMIDVLLQMPGFSAKEVEERATRPMEKLLWEIPGVEYIYSTSKPGQAIAILRFKVGEDVERSLVKLNQKLQSNFDRIPPGVSFPLIKARSIDDVPILSLTFHSSRYQRRRSLILKVVQLGGQLTARLYGRQTLWRLSDDADLSLLDLQGADDPRQLNRVPDSVTNFMLPV